MLNISREDLYQKYIVEYKPMWKVAEELGISVGAVHKYIKLYEIPTRDRHDYPTSDKERETWSKNGKAHKGKRLSNETKKKISEAHFKGGIGHKKKRADGYICVYFPDHPYSTDDGYIMEHILVMEAIIGRHLNEDECVHHKNEKRDDNRASNLQLMTNSEHMSYHMKKRWEEKRRDDLSIQ